MKSKSIRVALLTLILGAVTCLGSQSTAIHFEAATIKLIPPGTGLGAPTTACKGMDGTIPANLVPPDRDVPLGRCSGLFTLKFFVAYAYDFDPNDVTGVKDWMPATFYDIEAVAGNTATATKQDLRLMLQDLLADRFKLKVHRETHEIPAYNLIVAKSGAKMKVSAADARETYNSPRPEGGSRSVNGNGSMSYLASLIATNLKASVVDKTGLSGMYEFRFTYPTQLDSTAPTLFTTIEDLGLRLEAAGKVPHEIMVIDSAEKPAARSGFL